MALVDEAVKAGARLSMACAEAGIPARTLQRWRSSPDDRRGQVKRAPGNRLSELERKAVLAIANSPANRDLSPKQIVPRLADEGRYVASESTFYRVLRAEGLLKHREASRAPSARGTREHAADGPNQVWSWDITYLKSPVRGMFFYLYLVEDVWSRKIVGWAIHEREAPEHAAELIQRCCRAEGISGVGLVLHADNGSPMRGATMVATMQRLGVIPSFSRPSVSNDNAFSEALFRTLKYRPNFPSKPFASLAAACAWVTGFTDWYNTKHLHSALRFVTPADRHAGREADIFARRRGVYEQAQRARPERWRSATRTWEAIKKVVLNPQRERVAA
jgi:putative transposase